MATIEDENRYMELRDSEPEISQPRFEWYIIVPIIVIICAVGGFVLGVINYFKL